MKTNPLVLVPRPRRPRRDRSLKTLVPNYDPTPPAPPIIVGPQLVEVQYTFGLALLLFDRAVDIGGIDLAAIAFDDPLDFGRRWDASGAPAQPQGADGVVLTLADLGPAQPGDAIRMFAAGDNGIVAAADGVAWAGTPAGGLVLPFPA